MKYVFSIFIFFLLLIFPIKAQAQGMMGNFGLPSGTIDSSETAKDEADGKAIWDKLQTKQIDCKSLPDDDFDVLGDYFMGQSIGNVEKHAFMNQRMKNMMGEQGEKQMHIALGKRLSSCNTNAQFPSNGVNFLPMMGFGTMVNNGGWRNMMGWNSADIFNWTPILLILGLLLLAVFIFSYLRRQSFANTNTTNPLDILSERYAKGEIDKNEYEEKKRDLSAKM